MFLNNRWHEKIAAEKILMTLGLLLPSAFANAGVNNCEALLVPAFRSELIQGKGSDGVALLASKLEKLDRQDLSLKHLQGQLLAAMKEFFADARRVRLLSDIYIIQIDQLKVLGQSSALQNLSTAEIELLLSRYQTVTRFHWQDMGRVAEWPISNAGPTALYNEYKILRDQIPLQVQMLQLRLQLGAR